MHVLLFVPYPLYALPVGRKVGWFFLMPDNRGMCWRLCLLMFGYFSFGPGREKEKGVIYMKGVGSEFFSPVTTIPWHSFALAFFLCQNIEPIVWLFSSITHLNISSSFSISQECDYSFSTFFCSGYMTGWLRVVSAWAVLLGQPDSGMQDQELIVGC